MGRFSRVEDPFELAEFGLKPDGDETTYIPHLEYALTRIFVLGHIRGMTVETLRALGEPSRFQIVELLREGPRPVGEMVARLGLRQPQVSKHLRVLSQAGLVQARVDAQRRIYALRPAPLQELELWLERYKRLWEGNFRRLDTLLEDMKASEKDPGGTKNQE
jgi:DNA-binding transcriptional ArsR family regulator